MRTLQRSLTFEVDYPEADGDVQPRHRLVGEWRESWGMEKELENGERQSGLISECIAREMERENQIQ